MDTLKILFSGITASTLEFSFNSILFLSITVFHKSSNSVLLVSYSFTLPKSGKSIGEVITILERGNVNTVPPKVSCSKIMAFKFCFFASKEAEIPAGPAPTITRS